MSKRQVHTNGNEAGSYTTSLGEHIEFLRVRPILIQKAQSLGDMPPVPYRENMTAFGEAEKEELTAEDLRTDEEKKIWDTYQKEVAKVEELRNTELMRVIFSSGIKFDESKMEEWKREIVEDYGYDLPSNKIDLRFQYVQSELIGKPEDVIEIMVGVIEQSGIPEKEMNDIRATFRSALRENTPS